MQPTRATLVSSWGYSFVKQKGVEGPLCSADRL